MELAGGWYSPEYTGCAPRPFPVQVCTPTWRKHLRPEACWPDEECRLLRFEWERIAAPRWARNAPPVLAEFESAAEYEQLVRASSESLTPATLLPRSAAAAQLAARPSPHPNLLRIVRWNDGSSLFLSEAGRQFESVVRLGVFRTLHLFWRPALTRRREELAALKTLPLLPRHEPTARLAVTLWGHAHGARGAGFPGLTKVAERLGVCAETLRHARRRTPPALAAALGRKAARAHPALDWMAAVAFGLEDELFAQQLPGVGELEVGFHEMEARAFEDALQRSKRKFGVAAGWLGVDEGRLRRWRRGAATDRTRAAGGPQVARSSPRRASR